MNRKQIINLWNRSTGFNLLARWSSWVAWDIAWKTSWFVALLATRSTRGPGGRITTKMTSWTRWFKSPGFRKTMQRLCMVTSCHSNWLRWVRVDLLHLSGLGSHVNSWSWLPDVCICCVTTFHHQWANGWRDHGQVQSDSVDINCIIWLGYSIWTQIAKYRNQDLDNVNREIACASSVTSMERRGREIVLGDIRGQSPYTKGGLGNIIPEVSGKGGLSIRHGKSVKLRLTRYCSGVPNTVAVGRWSSIWRTTLKIWWDWSSYSKLQILT